MWIRVRDRFMNSTSRPVRFEFGTPATMTIIALPPRTERFTFVRENRINKLKLTTTRIYTNTYRVVHRRETTVSYLGKTFDFFKNFLFQYLHVCISLLWSAVRAIRMPTLDFLNACFPNNRLRLKFFQSPSRVVNNDDDLKLSVSVMFCTVLLKSSRDRPSQWTSVQMCCFALSRRVCRTKPCNAFAVNYQIGS